MEPVASRPWNWSLEKDDIWTTPSEESFHLAARWKEAGFRSLLDFGCGLGRHAVFFAKQGFSVTAFDLSPDGVGNLKEWAEREGLRIEVRVADMLTLPYPDAAFDCLFAFHVVSHTDTLGMARIAKEIARVLRPGGEFYLTLCSKESWSFAKAGYPKLDENTVVKTGEGPEKGVPHFYTDLDGVLRIFAGTTVLRVRHIDDCYFDGAKRDSRHYFILGRKENQGATRDDDA
jgi:SAM-dependent methyltransferase